MKTQPSPVVDVELPGLLVLDGESAGPEGVFPTVAGGDKVAAFTTVARNRARAYNGFTSPVDGVVRRVLPGPRRRLERIEIVPDKQQRAQASPVRLPEDRAGLRTALIDAGLWEGLLARPFNGVADPEIEPAAILVTGFFSDPAAPDVADILRPGDIADLEDGLRVVAALAGCGAVLAHTGANPLAGRRIDGLDYLPMRRAALRPDERFVGELVGRIGPARVAAPVWLMDWQEAIEIGQRLRGRAGPVRRIVAMRGAGRPAALLNIVVGTPLADLAGEDGDEVLGAGHPVTARIGGAIGRHDDRISVFRHVPPPERPVRGPIVPHPALEAALPFHPAPVALLRALAAGDHDAAAGLGALDLGPDDLALAQHICPSGRDYPALLTSALTAIASDWGR